MPHAKINGIDIYFEQHGDAGDPLFFVHGYTGDVSDWRFQIAEFSRTHRVLVMDNRGHGRSEAPADRAAYTVDHMASDSEALADELGFGRYHLVGHSMGGAIAQEIALRSPGRLMSLTLHDTGHTFDFSRIEGLTKFIEMRLQLAERQGMAALASMSAMAPQPPHKTKERIAEESERLTRMSVDAYIGAHMGLNAWPGSRDRLASIASPTMVVYGDLDLSLLVDAAKLMAATIPGAVLEVIAEAGHSPQYERPELFNSALRRHIERSMALGAK